MQRLLMVMYRRIISDGIKNSLKGNPDAEVYVEHNYDNAVFAANTYLPNVILLEIPENRAWAPEPYIRLCAELKGELPGCKLLLMCPENSRESKLAAIDAMRRCMIHDFIYFNVTLDYLLSKLEVFGPGLGSIA